MGAENILKIAGDLRKTSLDEAQKRFGGLNDATDEKNEELGDFSGTVLVENIPPAVDAAKNSNTDTEPVVSSVVEPAVENKIDIAAQNKANAKKRIQKNTKKEKQETVKNVEPEVRSDQNTKESQEKIEIISKLRQEVDKARKEYLEIDYKKNDAFNRVRKYFGGIKKDKNERGFENDHDIAFYRAYYDNKLFDLQKTLLHDAKEKGASDEDLAKLYIEFRTEQKIDLAVEHDHVKIEQKAGTLGGFVGEKAVQITKKYQSLPLKVKLGIGIAMLGAGAAASTVGGAVVGAVGAAAIARRIFGGLTAGVGTRLALEAKGQMKDKKNIEKEEKEFLDKLKNLSDEEKYKLLSENIKNIAIKDSENTINKIKKQDIYQITAGAMAGTFLASGMAGDLIKAGYHNIAGIFGGGHADDLAGSNPPEVPKDGVLSHDAIAANKESINDFHYTKQFEYPKESGVVAAPIANETLTIEKGSSIEGTLIKFYKEHDLKFKDNGWAAHRAYLDYMEDYIRNHRDELIETGKLDEYQKMLKDGMVNVKPGTEIVIDPHTGNIISIDGKLSHLYSNYSATENGNALPVTPEIASVTNNLSENLPGTSTVISEKVPDSNFSQELSKELASDVKGEILSQEEKYRIAAAVANGEKSIYIDNANPNMQANLDYFEELSKAAEQDQYAPFNEMGRIESAIKSSKNHMKLLFELNDRDTFIKIGRDFFDSKSSNIAKFGKMNVLEALNDPQKNLDGLSDKAKNLIMGYANNPNTKPVAGENFKNWAIRLMKITSK